MSKGSKAAFANLGLHLQSATIIMPLLLSCVARPCSATSYR